MILLVDAGNTRIKWGVLDERSFVAEGSLGHGEIAELAGIAAAHPRLERVVGANVAGAEVARAIAAAVGGVAAAEWLVASTERCGVRNGYDEPARLGADRWAALIGARAMHPAAACLVVVAGTATTVDMLDASGAFVGGLILPGEELMRRALAGNTAQLPFADGRYVAAPRNTADAIVSGCLHAQAGAVERMFARIADAPGARCVLSGGGAGRLEELLGMPLVRIDNLVLKGLAVVARDDTSA